jgi:hypothetical protein
LDFSSFSLAQAFTPAVRGNQPFSFSFQPPSGGGGCGETIVMGHAFHQLYYHFAWATHSRIQLIRRDHRPQILSIINEEAKKRGGYPIRHNAMPDHVHLLV